MMNTAFLERCETMIRQHSSTFYKAFRFLESPKREAVYVMYAFCRMIDDSVDEPERSPYTLDELEGHFSNLETAHGHFIWPALRWLFHTFPLSPEPFYKQMEGQRMDRYLFQYETFDQLEQYCYLVAGTVGEMLLPILIDRPLDDEIVQSGIYIGKAMQIVNIVRDIGEDWERGRRYIPLEVLGWFGCTERPFVERSIDPAFCSMIDGLTTLATDWMNIGLKSLDQYPATSAFCVELAARTYLAILDEVKANRYQVFSKRAIVGNGKKISMAHELLHRYPDVAKKAALSLAVL